MMGEGAHLWVGTYKAKLDWKARSEEETWYAYGDNCIKQSLAILEDPPKRVAGPNTRITRALKHANGQFN